MGLGGQGGLDNCDVEVGVVEVVDRDAQGGGSGPGRGDAQHLTFDIIKLYGLDSVGAGGDEVAIDDVDGRAVVVADNALNTCRGREPLVSP